MKKVCFVSLYFFLKAKQAFDKFNHLLSVLSDTSRGHKVYGQSQETVCVVGTAQGQNQSNGLITY